MSPTGARPQPAPEGHSEALRDALSRSAPEVAAQLLGWRLRSTTADGTVCVVLTEVEAYAGAADPASHAFRGRTSRNSIMFGEAGHLYVYFSYGMHWCANVVCGPPGEAAAVLLRAGRVVEGVDLASLRREGGRRSALAHRQLARGPACLTQALGIDASCSGVDLLSGGSPSLTPPDVAPQEVSYGPRVGVSLAADQPWRYWLTGDETVSAYKRSPRAS